MLAVGVAFVFRVPVSPERARRAVINVLSERLNAEVELGSLNVELFPRPRADGTNLVIRHRGRRDVPPFISIRAFEIRGGFVGLWRHHIGRVDLDGLEIQIPPRIPGDEAPRTPQLADGEGNGGTYGDVVVDEVVSTDAKLVLIPRESFKPPKTWDIHSLRIESVGRGEAMPFTAELTNAVPPGQIDTTGTFGPWNSDEMGLTPLGGTFVFENADLGVFKGISGTLASKGAFGGALGRIEVQGETTTPNFAVTVAGNPMPLASTYSAIVDGTDGNTYLERVDATLEKTPIAAVGKVVRLEGIKGRLVDLAVTIEKGRLEDVLRLAVKGPQPPMTGSLYLETTLALPPGDEDVVRKLQLDGAFRIDGGRFTDPTVQRQINELSLRAGGKKAGSGSGSPPPRVTSDFSGRFVLGDGTLRLATVTFDVPGAVVELSGRYGLEPETLDFTGNLFMEAKLSETVSGFKSLVLKVVDPMFRKDGKTVVPLRIGGTRGNPAIGLDTKRIFSKGQ